MIAAADAGARARRATWAFAAGLLASASLASAALASAADAASLKISVPSRVKHGAAYTVTVSGTFKKREIKRRAFLISLIQFSSGSCKRSAQEENDWAIQTNAYIQFYFAPDSNPKKGRVGIFTSASPFTNTTPFNAGTVGTRHVCAYLYPSFIKPSSVTQPIARADKRYRVSAR